MKKPLVAVIVTLGISLDAYATNGFKASGYGIQSAGSGGAAIALGQDTLVIASNPAGLAWLHDRFDAGLIYFRPDREAEIEGSLTPFNGQYSGNDTQDFFIPEFGFKKQLSDNIALGLAVYNNGGLVQDYKPGFPLFAGPNGPKTGIELRQIFAAPAIAWKITPNQSIGIGLNIAYQTFEAKGLGALSPLSQSPAHVTDNGKDSSYGLGLHFGWSGQLTEKLTLGAAYQTRIHAQRFDKYKGLFPDHGDFDIAPILGLGVAYKVLPNLTIAADYQRIDYSDTDSTGNPLDLSVPFGSSRGTGFGWRDMNVYKIGLVYQYSPQLTLRTGFNKGKQPVPSDQTLYTVFAPGIAEDHVTLGATWKLDNNNEVSFSYIHGFEKKVHGHNSVPAAFGGGDINFKMRQDALGIAYSWVY